MGKASRQRRLNKEKKRQRQRAARDASSRGPGLGYRPGRRQVPSQQDLVNSLIGEAVYALCGGSQEAYGGCVQQLANERAPGWTQAVSRSLVEFMRLSVTAAWRHGWQPAELARHVRRELSDTHAEMAADMITDEMRGYAAATVDARWAAQVAALDATSPQAAAAGSGAWWGSDAEYLGAWQGLAGDVGPRGAVATAVETLHVFQHLAVLERLSPLPGTAQPTAQRADPIGAADERLLGKIRALLAKAEATEFAEEAEALSARAQELMAKYSIDHALLAAETGRTEEPSGRRIAVDNPYEAPKASLLQTVAWANRCRIVWSKELGLVTVIGFPADLDAIELLFTSLLVQANTAMLRAGAKRDAYGRSRTRAFRQSFLVSYAIRIGERLSEATGHAEQQAAAEQAAAAGGGGGGGGKDLVPFLAARHQAVDDAVDAMFGDTLTTSRAVRATDAEGWHSGRVAADMASLHNHAQVVGATTLWDPSPAAGGDPGIAADRKMVARRRSGSLPMLSPRCGRRTTARPAVITVRWPRRRRPGAGPKRPRTWYGNFDDARSCRPVLARWQPNAPGSGVMPHRADSGRKHGPHGSAPAHSGQPGHLLAGRGSHRRRVRRRQVPGIAPATRPRRPRSSRMSRRRCRTRVR